MTEIVASQTPPILHGPSEKERKYDRQLRLWAASGQAALESANILVLNAGGGTVVVEALKNLILPGIGRFTIYDEAVVEEADLGVNFFLDEASLGKSRAQSCTELLQELNPEVQGEWHPKPQASLDLAKLLETSPTFTMILYAHPVQQDTLDLLDKYGEEHKTPLVSVHSAGFYSYFRVRLPGAFPIVDTHPDETAATDLRLLAPWPELTEFARELTGHIDDLGAHEHGHLPYIAILLYYLERWREAHGGANPSTYKEKTAFRQTVADAARKDNPEGGEENFDEAVAAVLRNIDRPSVPSGLREVFEYEPKGFELKSGFWIIANAVKQFYEKHQALPLSGKVPDMKAASQVYVKLQTIYKTKARKDAAEVLATVQAAPGGKDIDPGEVDLFCKNAAFVKLINATPPGENRLVKLFEDEMANDENVEITMAPLSLVPIYLALQATAHAPSSSAETILKGIDGLVPGASQYERVAKIAEELARTGGSELHNVSALTGGMVAQEMIKIITKQYVPIDNTCVFDGITSRCQILHL
ncbi:amyloid beta precursor protein binding protein 1 [Sporothrix brasiliensis 5110]|uniref:NEDD8-activating enzyme E1 regulatory subunit n=1 Tax=Sporothrix brasiliensis 5110 TaxID=1398154 RepID=A0A0C2FUU9_9PEZI|nr:amyloid beta precursor protein binding protein 1 [Sporothrix brasiliensis 5110]KIH94788.1 amyloid beta precursor protein binding protein 1 [Sporothrix brasiliensis 5110]